MNKRLKSLLTLTLITGLAFSAMAAEMESKVGGKAVIFLGQYDSGKDGEESYISDYGEANLHATMKSGELSGYVELEFRTGGAYNANKLQDTQAWIQWEKKKTAVKLGTIVTPEGVPFGYGNLTTALPADFTLPLFTSAYVEDSGVSVRYKGIKGHSLAATYFTVAPMKGNDTSKRSEGNGYAAGASGKFGSFDYKLQYLGETQDDVNNKDDKALNAAVTSTDLRYSTKAFALSVDYLTISRQSLDTFKSKVETLDSETVVILAAKAKKVGPGNAMLAYGTANFPDGKSSTRKERVKTGIHATYNLLNLLPGVVQFSYLSEKDDYASDVKDAKEVKIKDTVATFVGVGMKLQF